MMPNNPITKPRAPDPIETIVSRVTPALLGDPGPSETEIRIALDAAAAAPDHGRLRPWRFVVLAGKDREKLATLFKESLQRQRTDVSTAELEAEGARALRAPVVIVVAAAVQKDHPKVPEIEQILSAGAAVQNLTLALLAMGYGTMWKTGPVTYDPLAATALGFGETDQIVAFLYVGTTKREGGSRHRIGAQGLICGPSIQVGSADA